MEPFGQNFANPQNEGLFQSSLDQSNFILYLLVHSKDKSKYKDKFEFHLAV